MEIRIESDGMLIQPYLHDSNLVAVNQIDSKGFELDFVKPDDVLRVRLTVRSAEHSSFWAAGVAMSGIVSVVRVIQNPIFEDFKHSLSDKQASHLLESMRMYMQRECWLMLFEMNYGDPVAVLGSGPFSGSMIVATRLG